MGKKAFCLIFAFLLSINSFAAVVADNDGSAFITKAEFDSLKNNFQTQLDSYNSNIDSKIDNAIAGYLSGITTQAEKTVDSLLNILKESRRTFVGNISNPTASEQENLYIQTCSFWAYFRMCEQGYASADRGPWLGFEISGINNYGPDLRYNPSYIHHVRYPLALDNLDYGTRTGNGNYVFVEPASDDTSENEMYITDEYLKKLKFYIWSVGGASSYGTDMLLHSPTSYALSSISWDATYNWAGTNSRAVATYNGQVYNWNSYTINNKSGTDSVLAAETIYLDISNQDTDTSTTGVQPISWVNNVTGGTIYTANTGCLKTQDQYKWSYRYTNFYNGTLGSQCYGANYKNDNTYYNGTNNHTESTNCRLSFYAPKISNIPGTRLLIEDAEIVAGKRVHYYNGLPLCVIDKEGEVNLEIRVTMNGTGATNFTLAIAKDQFGNNAISSEPESNILYRASKSITDADITGGVLKIKIDKNKLSGINSGTLWIKAIATNGTKSSVTLESNSIKIKYDN